MKQKTAILVALGLTAFVLIVAGGVAYAITTQTAQVGQAQNIVQQPLTTSGQSAAKEQISTDGESGAAVSPSGNDAVSPNVNDAASNPVPTNPTAADAGIQNPPSQPTFVVDDHNPGPGGGEFEPGDDHGGLRGEGADDHDGNSGHGRGNSGSGSGHSGGGDDD